MNHIQQMEEVHDSSSSINHIQYLHKDRKGQSTIEVIVCIGLVLMLLMVIIKFGLNSVSGFMVHYANYMASRTYLTYDGYTSDTSTDLTTAESRARDVFNRYNLLQYFPSGSTIEQLQFVKPDAATRKVFVGTYVKFKQHFAGGPMFGGNAPIEFTSESFLGREPLRYECLDSICNIFSSIAGTDACAGGTSGSNVTIYDNGC